MVSNRDDVNACSSFDIYDAEGKRPQYIAPIVAVDVRPPSRCISDVSHRSVKGIEKEL
jgi:hypothetical protein